MPPNRTMTKAPSENLSNRRRSLSDPLTAALQPPPNETEDEREQRLNAEYEAKKVSDGIDQMIAKEKNELKKAKPEVKVLLLGQSESGKSTTLKRERLAFLIFNRIKEFCIGQMLSWTILLCSITHHSWHSP